MKFVNKLKDNVDAGTSPQATGGMAGLLRPLIPCAIFYLLAFGYTNEPT